MTPWEQRLQVIRGCLVLFVVIVCAFLWFALLSFDPLDYPSAHVWPHPEPAHNVAGLAGAWVAYHLFVYLGKGAYALVIGLTLALTVLLRQGRLPSMWQRILGIALLVGVTSCGAHMWTRSDPGLWLELRGGVFGYFVAEWLTRTMKLFAVPVLGYCFLVGLLFTTEGAVMKIPEAIRRRRDQLREMARSGGPVGEKISGWLAPVRRLFERFRMPRLATQAAGRSTSAPKGRAARSTTKFSEEPKQRAAGAATAVEDEQAADESEEEWEDGEWEYVDDDGSGDDGEYEEGEYEEGEYEEGEYEEGEGDDDGEWEEGEWEEGEWEDDGSEEEDEDAHCEPVAPEPQMVVKFAAPPKIPAGGAEAVTKAYPASLESWEFPPVELLEDPEFTYNEKQEAFVREKAQVLKQTLQDYRIEANVVQIDTGPVITMYEIQVAPGVKVSQIQSLSNDIARAMKAPSVRVVAPIPGKSTIGIEVPNVDKEKVRIKELMMVTGAEAQKMALPLFLGKNASGDPLVGDLAKMPHMLIAGTTGSGKSVCINSIIVSLVMTQRPDMVKMILVDPKMVELSIFRDVPHLMCPIVTEMERAEKILEWATVKMDERYALLAEAGVRNIAAYNRLSDEEKLERFQPSNDDERAKIPMNLPYVVIVIDELADMMMLSAKEVEHHLSRLAQKSRAVGIHIIVATQRPEAKIVTGLIKSNLPCRVAFRVASRMDSRIVLDQNGAEVLMGQGDMLYLPPGSSKLVRAQGAFLEDQELKHVLNFLKDAGTPEFHPELMQLGKTEMSADGPRDELFNKAVDIVLETRRGSVSLLQRRLAVGYARASRLIEEMAAAGIVGDYKGSQAREVVITGEQWQAMKESEAADVRDRNNADGVPDMMFDDDL